VIWVVVDEFFMVSSMSATFSIRLHQKGRVVIFGYKEAPMKIKESSWDSVLRIFSGFFLLYLGLGGELTGILAMLAILFGLFLLLTGVIGFCPLYILLRWKK
jgi:hypothetical protein